MQSQLKISIESVFTNTLF